MSLGNEAAGWFISREARGSILLCFYKTPIRTRLQLNLYTGDTATCSRFSQAADSPVLHLGYGKAFKNT